IEQQEAMRKKAVESGYADIEIDALHKKIKNLLPKLKILEKSLKIPQEKSLFISSGEQNGYKIILQIAFGESIKSISERYIYDGKAILYTDAEGTVLNKVEFRFLRINPLGYSFKEEGRSLVNPTPNFFEDNQQIDKNEDLILEYFERTNPDEGFVKKHETTISDIIFIDKRLKLLETYRKFLRRTKKMIKRKVYDFDLQDRVRVQYMLEFQ
ncbi:unnamed protein product, partial [marine sediment metagenome]